MPYYKAKLRSNQDKGFAVHLLQFIFHISRPGIVIFFVKAYSQAMSTFKAANTVVFDCSLQNILPCIYKSRSIIHECKTLKKNMLPTCYMKFIISFIPETIELYRIT